jgi:hypothetical protein
MPNKTAGPEKPDQMHRHTPALSASWLQDHKNVQKNAPASEGFVPKAQPEISQVRSAW